MENMYLAPWVPRGEGAEGRMGGGADGRRNSELLRESSNEILHVLCSQKRIWVYYEIYSVARYETGWGDYRNIRLEFAAYIH